MTGQLWKFFSVEKGEAVPEIDIDILARKRDSGSAFEQKPLLMPWCR
jgi:hypothetical protein